MKLAANLSMMFQELPFSERMMAANRAGFKSVECMFPYELPLDQLLASTRQAAVQWVLINAPAGEWSKGDRGLASDPKRREEFYQSIEQAVQYATALRVDKVHVLAGCLPNNCGEKTSELFHQTYLENLNWLCEQTQAEPITWLIEPINTRDVPNYLLNYQDQAHQIVTELGHQNLAVQMDLYHCQIMEGDIVRKLERYLPGGKVAHIQIAGVPERNEPSVSELDYRRVFQCLKALNYQGAIGCEYRPLSDTEQGLSWISKLSLEDLLR